jgi:hypothetical protein
MLALPKVITHHSEHSEVITDAGSSSNIFKRSRGFFTLHILQVLADLHTKFLLRVDEPSLFEGQHVQ